MQIIVLGMHRSGTSVVARLLNLMGTYFAPERMELPATTANPKGYWERRDVVNLNEDILKALDITWDKIGDFTSKQLTPDVFSPFKSLAQEIILGLDAHRPWMLKDPRLCLLLPYWLPLLEIPVCVYVHRNPIQIAQSLRKRDGFSVHFGIALWEKYTLHALADSAKLPRFLISYHDLMSKPLETTKILYENLLALNIQGLRLPTDKEILAFIEPTLFHAQGDDSLQNAFINRQQADLISAFVDGSILTRSPLPSLSSGAIEILAEYEAQWSTAEQKARQHAEEIAHLQDQLQQQIAELEQTLDTKKREISKHQTQATRYKDQWLTAKESVIQLKQTVTEKEDRLTQEANRFKQELATLKNQRQQLQNEFTDLQTKEKALQTSKEKEIAILRTKTQGQEQSIRELLHWIDALNHDISALFNSLTWRTGNFMTQLALKLMFRKPDPSAQDHIQVILREIATRHYTATTAREPTTALASTSKPIRPPLSSLPARLKTVVQNHRDYPRWIKNYDTLTPQLIEKIHKRFEQWEFPPLISIVMPTYNTEEKWLRTALNSVQEQIYPFWELCVADDASTQPHVRQILEEYAGRDQRIKLTFRTENGHISAASNSALELVTGEFVTFLDHDDKLAPQALFWVAQDILDYPDALLWYSDEDKIDAQDKRFEPYFKSDWNPDLFLSHNLITHLAVYRTELVKHIGGFREGYEGAQDYDLALRALAVITPLQIRHIPRILYHWRAIKGSTAIRPQEKPYALVAAQKAIGEFLEKQGIDAVVTESPEVPGTSRVQYLLPANPPLVSLIIPTYNGLKLLRSCVNSIFQKTDYQPFELLIIDNASDDPETLSYLQQLQTQYENVRIIEYPYPFNYADMNNRGVAEAQGEIIGLLNNDLEVITAGWLTEMVSHALRPEIGAVGARLWYANDTLQHGGVVLGIGGGAGHAHKGFPRGHVGYMGRAALIQNFSAVTGACMLVRKAVFEQAGGLDAERLTVALNDVDFCLKLNKMNLRVLWTPYAELYHHESASRGYEDTPEKIARYDKERACLKERWEAFLVFDPAYSPNLTLETQDFAFAWPPRISVPI